MEQALVISIVVIILGWNLYNMIYGTLPNSVRAFVALAVLAIGMFFAPFLLNGI